MGSSLKLTWITVMALEFRDVCTLFSLSYNSLSEWEIIA